MGSDWSSIWSGATALITLGLLIATGIYAWLTYRLVRATEQQSWEISRPRILVGLQSNQGGQLLVLHIENIGMTSAEKLKLTFDRPVHQSFGSKGDVQDVPIFREGVRAFPPRTPIRIGLGGTIDYLGDSIDRDKHPLSFTIMAEYHGAGRSFKEPFAIDVRRQYFATLAERDYLEDFGRKFPDAFSKEMRELVRAIKAIGSKSE